MQSPWLKQPAYPEIDPATCAGVRDVVIAAKARGLDFEPVAFVPPVQ